MNPEIIFNPELKEDYIQSIINKYGHHAEHNYNYFLTYNNKKNKSVFIDFENSGVLAIKINDNNFQFLADPLCEEDKKPSMILDAAKLLFEIGVKNILLEITKELRSKILQLNKTNSYNLKIGNVIEKYYTPLISMKEWDPELSGPDFSNLRKAKNRFYREHKIKILETADFELLNELVLRWKESRKANDRAYYDDYLELFKNNFSGTEFHIIIEIDGKICAVAACYKIPNSNNVYYSINLHDYSIPDLGDFLTITFFDELKKKEYEYVNFGSSDENLLKYKKKFKPASIKESVCFYLKK